MEILEGGRQKLHPFSWNFDNADPADDVEDKPYYTRFVMSAVTRLIDKAQGSVLAFLVAKPKSPLKRDSCTDGYKI